MARHPRKKSFPNESVKTIIHSLTHDGRGVSYVEGKAVFIDDALPNEEVEFMYTDIRKDYAEGKVTNVLIASPKRTQPLCPHYGICGGCSFQHVESTQQIHIKQQLLIEQFKRIGKLDISEIWSPLESSPWGYRRKARLGVKYVAKKNRVLVGFRERRNPFLAEMENCLVLHPSVGLKLTKLGEMIATLSIKEKIPQIEVAIGDNECVLAIRILETPTFQDKEILREFGRFHNLNICLQPKGVDTIAPLDGELEVIPMYSLPAYGITFKFRPAMFTQVNYEINQKMISRVLDVLQLTHQDTVLDLFCGLGNFTLPMAKYAEKVVGIEGDLPLVNHAKQNALFNDIHNVDFYAADLTRDISQQVWAKQNYNKIVLDPSRAGASEILHHFKQWQPEKIVYVSCNPSTLARDAGILVNELNYRLDKAGVMDMFPQTAHVESIAVFSKI